MNKRTVYLILLLSVLLLGTAHGTAQSESPAIFAHLRDNTRVSQLSLIGTHNSATFGVRAPHRGTSKCVRQTFEEQFEMGVRYFDIRLNLKDGDMKAYHGLADCHIDWETIQEKFKALLTTHPNEIIFVRILRADDTFRTDVTSEEWEAAFAAHTDKKLYVECLSDTEIGNLRGRVVCINKHFMRFFPYVSNEDYTLKATAKGIEQKIENIRNQVTNKVPDGRLNLVTFNSRGHTPVLSIIPNPEKFADKLSINYRLPESDEPVWCNFDFPEKFAGIFPDILKRNEKFLDH